MAQVRQEIHDEVCEKGFDPSATPHAYYGSKELDASLLMTRSPLLPPPIRACRPIERSEGADVDGLSCVSHRGDRRRPPPAKVIPRLHVRLIDNLAMSASSRRRRALRTDARAAQRRWAIAEEFDTRAGAWSATFRRLSRMLAWSTRRTTLTARESPRPALRSGLGRVPGPRRLRAISAIRDAGGPAALLLDDAEVDRVATRPLSVRGGCAGFPLLRPMPKALSATSR